MAEQLQRSKGDGTRVAIFDLEANGFLNQATKVHCGVFIDLVTNKVTKFRPNEIQDMLKFMDTYDVLIAHNGLGYDWPLLEKLYNYKFKNQKVDTLIMSRLLNPKRLLPPNCPNKQAGPHSVEAWGYRVGRGKPEHNDWEEFSEEMLHRCTEDVQIQKLIFNELKKEYSGKNWKNAFKLSFKLFEYLQKQEQYGWLVDQEHMHKCIHQLEFWINRIDKVLDKHLPLVVEVLESKDKGEYKYVKKPFLKSGEYSTSIIKWMEGNAIDPSSRIVGGPFTRINLRKVDLNSNDETKQFLLGAGWEPVEWNTNDAGEQTSPKLSKDDPFDGINGAVGRLVAKRVQCRQRKSIIEGLFGIIRSDGRIASVINNLATTARATHRGIVNIPKASSFYGKQMRKIFICKKGYVLVGTDSDSCQLRMLGGRMGSKAYIEALCTGDKSKGTDLHSLTRKIGELESRDIAKNVMYCLLFGGGDAKLGKTAKKPGQGAELRERLYKGFDGLGELMERLTTEWRNTAKRRYNAKWNRMEYYDGYITGLDGRPIYVPYEHQLLVYLLQSDEAIMMQGAYCKFHQLMEKAGYIYGKDYGTCCWYHDEFTVECKEELASKVAEFAEYSIAWAGEFFKIPCPHIGQAAIGRNWYDIH
ncbi:MAG TPA: DNA polymerase [Methanosarcina sp.]|nr:DNA polymerase [Methanosarcina sp.]